jgi:hypothetical protein
MDMIKVRIQVKSEAKGGSLSPFSIAKDIYRNEGGVKAFYKGYELLFNNTYIESTLHS